VAERYLVGPTAEIGPGQRRIVPVGGRGGIGVFNLGGEYYALRNLCPHRAGPLCQGRLRPYFLPGPVGEYAYEREGEILKCPWHEYEFDLRSGVCPAEPELRVQTYRVAVEDGQVALYLD
jgi:3-phenylpropionate/trans-cinnamate dioxygenase ferredoxin subunit